MATVTIQPSTADVFVDSGAPDTNNNSNDQLLVGQNGNSTNRALVKFDVSSIPVGSTISIAEFALYINGFLAASNDLNFYAQRVTASWSETTATWNNQPASVTTNRGSAIGPGANGFWTIPGLATIVSGWVNGTFTNHGLVLLSSNEATQDTRFFGNAREYSIASRHPKLTITYNAPPTAPTSLAPSGTSYTLSQTVAFSWTHNDPDGDAQSAYEIRWRVSASSDAYSTLTATTSTQSRNEPASTFNVGTWEYNVRTKDTGTSTFGAWSTTQTFTVTGIERWGVVHI